MTKRDRDNRVMLERDGVAIRQVPGECKLRSALEAVLLFHAGGDWQEVASAWFNRVQTPQATTKTLCDYIRSVLKEGLDPITPPPGR